MRLNLVVVAHAPAVAAQEVVAARPAPLTLPVAARVAVVAVATAVERGAKAAVSATNVETASLSGCGGARQGGYGDCCCGGDAEDGFLKHLILSFVGPSPLGPLVSVFVDAGYREIGLNQI